MSRRFIRRRSPSGIFWRMVVVGVAVSLGFGCGGKHGRDDSGGKWISTAGIVTLRGSTPFRSVYLATADEKTYRIQPSAIADELSALEGMSVEVTGSTVPYEVGEPPTISPTSYRLLSFEGSEQPIVGTIEIENGECRLVVADGTRITVTGALKPALLNLGGAKVWVIGDTLPSRSGEKSIDVTGYWVIRKPR